MRLQPQPDRKTANNPSNRAPGSCWAHVRVTVLGHSKLGRRVVSDTGMGAGPGGSIRQLGLGNHTGAGAAVGQLSVKML